MVSVFKKNLEITKFFKKNLILLLVFLISTTFFLLQHKLFLSWDFSAYVINAKYLFYGGDYFEVYRAPLISILLGFFLLFGNSAHYLYILFVSALFFFSVIKLADSIYANLYNELNITKKMNRVLFYILLLSPFVLKFGLIEGTELLGLAFLQLFLAAFLKNKISGHYLGLAVLSRYNFIFFAILLFLNKDYKKILKNMFIFLLVMLPWLLFNRIKWGNIFTSIVDSYYLNVLSRSGIVESFNFTHLFYAVNYLIPLFFVGIFFIFKSEMFKKKIVLIFLGILMFFLWESYTIPFKILRYLFGLSLPIAFFSLLGLVYIFKIYQKSKKYLILTLLLFFMISNICLGTYYFLNRNSQEIFQTAATIIKEIGFEDCKIVSNYWVPINYYSGNVFFLGDIDYSIQNNESILLFKGYTTFDDKFNWSEIDRYNYLIEKEGWILLGREDLTNHTCTKRHGWDKPMANNPCGILSAKFKIIKLDRIMEELCLTINKK